MVALTVAIATADTNPIAKRSFKYLGREDGLSNLAVSSIIQDVNGYLWFATQGGLNRYDGEHFKTYKYDPFEKDGILHNLIQTMYYDETAHVLWLGTYQGVSCLDISTDTFTNYTEASGLSDPVVVAIAQTDDKMWFGTMDGLTSLDKQGVMTSFEITDQVVRALYYASDQKLYIGTYAGLYCMDLDNQSITPVKVSLPSEYVMTIDEFDEGVLTLGLWDGGIVRLDLASLEIHQTTLPDNRLYSIIKSADGSLYCGTWGGGLYSVKDDQIIANYDSENSEMSSDVIYSLYEDYSGILWIGTNGGGIYKSNPRDIDRVVYKHQAEDQTSMLAGKASAIYEDTSGRLWVSIYDQSLEMKMPGRQGFQHFTTENSGLIDNLVLDIIERENILYLATGKGIGILDLYTFGFGRLPILDNDTLVYALAKDDQYLWIGTYGQGLFQYDWETGQTKQFNTSNSMLSDDLIYELFVDYHDHLWIGTNYGLNELVDGEIKPYRKIDGDRETLPSNVIQVIYEDQHNRLWIGTEGGGLVQYLGDGRFKSYTERDGLSSNAVVSILENEKQELVIATDSGITIYDNYENDFVRLTPEDGIGTWEFSRGHVRTSDNRLLFGGVHGITDMTELAVQHNIPPRIYITNIDVGHVLMQETVTDYNGREVNLRANDNHFRIDFTAIDYDNPEKTTYYYRLLGYENSWFNTETANSVNYSQIPSGDYSFEVFAKTAQNTISEVARVSLHISAHWYESPQAYLVYIFMGVVMIFVMAKIRSAYVIKHKNEELGYLNDQLEDLNHSLKELAVKDVLTGVYNRRYFTEEVLERIELGRRSNAYISLLMIDIDKFKTINDSYGHLIGDDVLIEVTYHIGQMLTRSTDFCARYGGDEFVVVLYDTDLEGSMHVANKIQNAIRGLHFIYEDVDFKMTVSIGIATRRIKKETTLKSLLELADEALYEAKTQGRDRITVK